MELFHTDTDYSTLTYTRSLMLGSARA